MAVQQVQNLPAQFVQDLGQDLATQVVSQSGVPVVSTGIAGISQQAGESAADFAARQQAAQAFTTRQQSLSGLAPQVAGQTALQQQAQNLATTAAGTSGIGSFEPFLNQAQQEATLASALGTSALGQLGTAAGTLGTAQGTLGTGLGTLGTGLGTLGTAGIELSGAGTALGTAATTFGGVPTGPMTTSQTQQYMSPYQSQVIDASLAEFDRNKQIQEQSIRDQQTALGALGSGRAGVQLAEFGTGAARERALLQAGLLQQGFNQAQGARQQDIANQFALGQAQAGIAGQQAGFAGQRAGLGQAQAGIGQGQAAIGSQLAGIGGQQAGIAGATQNLGQFRSGLAGQQAALGQASEGVLGTNISRLGQLGAINQAQAQANLDAQREAARQAAFLPQEQLDRYAAQVTGIMGGYPGQTQTTNIPNPTPLQSALGIGTTLAGIYGAVKGAGAPSTIIQN